MPGGSAARPTLTATVPPQRLRMLQARLGQSLPVGNEGAGTVVQAGDGAEQLQGRRVGMLGGAMYATYRRLRAADVIPLPDGASAADGASMFVNPLTALAMPETMRREGHTALIHTAAASNLGQMLVRICLADGVPLVNIVRSAEQAHLLQKLGADTAAACRQRIAAELTTTFASHYTDTIGLADALRPEVLEAYNRKATGTKFLVDPSR